MIGCVLTGHGSFAAGMLGALEMIAGPQEKFELVPFLEEESMEQFEAKMQTALDKLKNETDGIIIFSDLMGGTPFRTAMLASTQLDQVEVVAGTNLPLLIEGTTLRYGSKSIAEFLETILPVGKDGLLHAKLETTISSEPAEEEEGI